MLAFFSHTSFVSSPEHLVLFYGQNILTCTWMVDLAAVGMQICTSTSRHSHFSASYGLRVRGAPLYIAKGIQYILY